MAGFFIRPWWNPMDMKALSTLSLLVILAMTGNALAQQRNVLLIIADDLGTDFDADDCNGRLRVTPECPGGMCLRSRKRTRVLDTGASSCVHTARADWQGLEQGASPISSKTKHPMGYL